MSEEDLAKAFMKDSEIKYPAGTPLFADGVWLDCWPTVDDPPAKDLYGGYHGTGFDGEIGRMTIPRHGNGSAAKAPRNFNPKERLPGSINLAFFDGHVESSKLENLWNFYWNKTWIPQNPRPN
jgi:prepilin-type processing-associated H-X9-DG protein